MTTTLAPADDVRDFGYNQQLDRSLGTFASFAAGVSYLSILTGTFQLFYFGYGTAGPAYLWSWPLVFIGQLLVALCFAELAGHFPLAGSVYAWAKRLASATVAWLTGWVLLVGSIVTLAATVLALQITLPQIWSGFQVIGDGTGQYDGAVNAVVLGSVLIVLTTTANVLGVSLVGRIASIGVAIELTAAVCIIGVLAMHVVRGPQVVLQTQGTAAGHALGYPGAFLAASLASAYVLYGFDTAGSLGEETCNARRTAPRAILRALIASFVLGGLLLLFGLMSAPDLADPALSSASGGLQGVLLEVVGGPLGRVFLGCVVAAVSICALAVHTAAIRVTFAMARDGVLPFSHRLANVSPTARTPAMPAVVVGLFAIGILLLNVRQPQVFTVVTSIAVLLFYIAYLLVTGPMLLARLRGTWSGGGAFPLGRWGLPVNALAVLWGSVMAVNIGWPRAEVYNASPPHHWYLQWGAPLFCGVLVGVGLLMWHLRLKARAGVLASHAC